MCRAEATPKVDAEIAPAAIPEVAPEAALESPAQADDEGGFWSLLFDKGGVVTWIIAMLSAIGLPIAAVKFGSFCAWKSGAPNMSKPR